MPDNWVVLEQVGDCLLSVQTVQFSPSSKLVCMETVSLTFRLSKLDIQVEH